MADYAGKSWVSEHISDDLKPRLCWHEPHEKSLDALNLADTGMHSYSEFGQERFISLTTFKWELLRKSLNDHADIEYALFTDLDVIWLKDPSLEIEKVFRNPSIQVAAQDDTPKKGIQHFCSGVMAWRNSLENQHSLELLRSRQLERNISGDFIPDEPIFNQWFQEGNRKKVVPLDPRKIVIGHRFFHLFLRKKFTFRDLQCFHANYVIGEERKRSRLEAVNFYDCRNLQWIFRFWREAVIYLQQRFRKR